MIQMTTTRPVTMLAAAHHGVSKGDPIYAIWAQSKVKGNMPRPEATPNYSGQRFFIQISRFQGIYLSRTRFDTTTFLGANQVTKLK